jgi:hypothetical protein
MIDHHCMLVGICIGKGNIKKFFFFLLCLSLHCICTLLGSVLILVHRLSVNKRWTYAEAIALAVVVLSASFTIAILFMFFQQVFLISCGLTTNECLRRRQSTKLYSEGCTKNCKKLLCS